MTPKLKKVAPLYIYSTNRDAWTAAIGNLQAGDVAIVTGTNNRPDPTVDVELVEHIDQLRARKVHVLGYLPLDYGRKTLAEIEENANRWNAHGVAGLFYDECPATWSNLSYGRLWSTARCWNRPPGPFVATNPGTPVTGIQPGKGMLIIEHEGTTLPGRCTHPTWSVAIIYNSTDVPGDEAQLLANGWEWGYVTADGRDQNPFDGVIGA